MPVRDHNLPEVTNRPTITFLCANLGKGGPSNDIILQAAWDAGTDVLLIQEPWASRNNDSWLIKSHPGFDRYSPNTGGADTPRPRSAIYTRKGRDTQQKFLCGTSPDFAAVVIDNVTFVSIYRAPGVALPPLLSWNPAGPTVIGGDFNSVHPEWQPLAGRSHGDGHILTEWMLEHGMTLASSPGVPTHVRGNTLDLIWSNAGAIANVAPELDSTSDHLTLAGDVPQPNASGSNSIRLNSPIRVSDNALEDFTKVVGGWSRNLGRQEIRTAMDVENLASNLVEILSDAIKATGRRGSPQPGQSAPWWTDECREAKVIYRTFGDKASRKEFRRAVKTAKRQYWRRKFSEAKTDADMYRMARWAKPRQQGNTAPLRTANGFESDPRRRATLLRDMLLARFTSENDIEVNADPTAAEPETDHLPWMIEVTEEEAKWVATSCQDKAPGADNITVRLLRAAWPAIGQAVRALYEGSLRYKHFPTIFKLAEVILIPKPGRDLSTAKGWRPIALLSCLGKGLERLVAKRIAHTALSSQKVPQQLIGALPGRLANDLVACLVHDVEHTLSLRHKAVLVTLDVQGAFDATLHGRLLRRMKGMGWAPETIDWTASFPQGRSARVRYEGRATDEVILECGLPQGSPL